MPIYLYESLKEKSGCSHCQHSFEVIQSISMKALDKCPKCGGDVHRVPVAVSVGSSRSSFDNRAKSAGFSKLKKIGKGEYEKQY